MVAAKRMKRGDGALTRRLIAEAAAEIVRSQGAAALSARRLASAIGCEAMSLYHHFENMEAILDAIVELALEGLTPAGRGEGAGANRKIIARARRYLALAIDEPAVFRLVATRRWTGPNGAARAQEMALLFEHAGVPARQSLAATRALGAYLNGAGLALAAWRARGEDERAVKADLEAGLKTLVAALLPGEAEITR